MKPDDFRLIKTLTTNLARQYSSKTPYSTLKKKNLKGETFYQTSANLAKIVSNARFIQATNENFSSIEFNLQHVSPNTKLKIPLVYLRDLCQSPINYNAKTNQRRSNGTDLFERAKLSQECASPVQFDPCLQLLKIYWRDGSESQFKLDNLLGWALSQEKDRVDHVSKTLWNRITLKEVPAIPSKKLDFANLARLFLQFGVVSVVDVDSTNEAATRKLCELAAPYCNTIFGDFWTFGVEEKAEVEGGGDLVREDTAYSNEAIGPHTDGTYFEHPPGIQVFHCLKSAADGGETLLVDGFSVANQLKKDHPKLFEILSQTPVEHQYLEGFSGDNCGDEEERQIYARAVQSPAISLLGEEITHIRYNPYDRAPIRNLQLGPTASFEQTVQFYEAYEQFSQLINHPDQVLKVMLEPGTVLFINNFRVLHGRTVFKGSRKICGCYLSQDGFLAKTRPLLSRQLF